MIMKVKYHKGTGIREGELMVGSQCCYDEPSALLTLEDTKEGGVGTVEVQIPHAQVDALIEGLRNVKVTGMEWPTEGAN